MQSRCGLDELRRRYLRQQVELGGPDLVASMPLSDLLARPARGVQPSLPSSPEEGRTRPAAPALPAGTGAETPAGAAAPAGAAGVRDWRVGAPPIPGPGLVIEPPLLGTTPADWTTLDAVARVVAGCTKCALAQTRTQTVPGEGNSKAQLMLVGEGPGQTEDATGRPFVGRAGELLNGILAAIGFEREEVFICNVVKCRPPQNRKPLPDEMSACSSYLDAQLRLVRPKVILALGSTTAEALLKVKRSLTDLRGQVHSYQGTPLVVTYHPAALLRNPNWKKPTWDDVRIARQLVDR